MAAALKLIELGCEVDKTTFKAAMDLGRPELVRALAGLGYEPDVIFKQPVARAIDMGRSDLLEALLESGAKIGSPDDLISYLTRAASWGNIAFIEALLKHASKAGRVEFRRRLCEVTDAALAANRPVLAKSLIAKANENLALDRETKTDLMLQAIKFQNAGILEHVLAMGVTVGQVVWNAAALAAPTRWADPDPDPVLIDLLQLAKNSENDSINRFFEAIRNTGLDQLMIDVRSGNFLRRQSTLYGQGVSATVIGALEPLVAEIVKMDELLKPDDSSENSGTQRTVAFASLLARMDGSNIGSAYQDRDLSEDMVQYLTAKALQDIEAIRAEAKRTLELHFDQAVQKIANLCRNQTPDLLPSSTLARYWNRMAGMVPQLAGRVQSCWNAALKKANEQLILNNVPLSGLSAYLDKELSIFFAREYMSTTGHEDFLESRGTPAAVEALEPLLIQQAESLATYCKQVLLQSEIPQAELTKLLVDMV